MVYWRFRDRQDVLCAVLDEQVATALSALSEACNDQPAPAGSAIDDVVGLYLSCANALRSSVGLVTDIGYEVFSGLPAIVQLAQQAGPLLRSAGFSPIAAARQHHSAMALVLGVLGQLTDDDAAQRSQSRERLRRLEAQGEAEAVLGDWAEAYLTGRPRMADLRGMLHQLLAG